MMKWSYLLPLCLLSACMELHDTPDDVRLGALTLEAGPESDDDQKLIKKREMLDVEIITDTNYTKFSIGRFVIVRFYFCDNMDADVQGLGGLKLYRYDKKWWAVDDQVAGIDNSNPPHHYHTAFRTFDHSDHSITGHPTILDFDLRQDPRDVCFFVSTSSPYAFIDGRLSNVVRIPREQLIELFAHHPRRSPPPE